MLSKSQILIFFLLKLRHVVYHRHQLEGLLTEAVRKAVLQWVMRAAANMM